MTDELLQSLRQSVLSHQFFHMPPLELCLVLSFKLHILGVFKSFLNLGLFEYIYFATVLMNKPFQLDNLLDGAEG